MPPLVSIGMPVYNSGAYVQQALNSLLAQEYHDLELVISDNASTDSTQDICRHYERHDSRLRYYRSAVNRGGAWNFRRVFALCRGEFFMWAGSHDLWRPNFIGECKRALDADPAIVLAYPQTQIIDASGHHTCVTPDTLDTRGMDVLERTCVLVRELAWCNMVYGLFRRRVLRACRIGLNCLGADHVLLMEIALRGTICQVPEILFLRREFRPTESEKERIRNQLRQLDPLNTGPRTSWPYSYMGWEHLIGIYRASLPMRTRIRLLLKVGRAFYGRFRPSIHSEWRTSLF